MITETNAVAFRQNLGEYLNLVQYRKDSVLIKKDGKPVAALVDAALFERIRAMQDRFDALCDRIAQGYAHVPEEEARAEIEQACAEARRETADEWRAAGRLPPSAPKPKRSRRAAAFKSGQTKATRPVDEG